MNAQTATARRLVLAALGAGHLVSVFDGEAFPVKRSVTLSEIMANLGQADEEWLHVRTSSGERVGSFFLVWGNAADGSELIADHTDNDACRALYSTACTYLGA
jgi:hypothetical protein